MESEVSLPRPQQLASFPYSEPDIDRTRIQDFKEEF